jgi:hypothetical protein
MILLTLFFVLSFFCVSIEGATDTTFSAGFILTYDQMQHAGVGGIIVYDLSQRTLAFQFTGLGSKEIYQFNVNLGYGASGQYDQQYVWKVAPNSACSPCAQYANTKGFPFTNDTYSGGWSNTVLIPPSIKGMFGGNVAVAGVDSQGCTRYNAPPNSWASYFGIKGNNLCYLADTNGRLFTIVEGSVKPTYDPTIIVPPTGCKCLLPVDIAVSLDRSSSITTGSTSYYNAFMKSFANSFYFNATDTANTAQLSITQWGSSLWSLSSIGNLNFTSNIDNIQTAASVVGCTTKSTSDCGFCYNCNNKKRAHGHGSCTPKKPSNNDTSCTFGESTCTGCGIHGMADQFTRTTYNNRPTATKIAIVITDGRSNTPYPGEPTYQQGDCELDSDQSPSSRQKIGCYLDITNARNYLISKMPSVVTYAIGVGNDISATTLDRISGSPDRSFNVSTFSDLLTNIQKFVLGFCPLPNPITECGTSCCGFCQCGVCVAPDTPLPSDFCDPYNYTLSSGNCFIQPVAKAIPPCPPQNCKSVQCSNTSGCLYTDNCGTGRVGINPCFDYQCVNNSCQPSAYLCAPNTTRSPTTAPSVPTTEAPPTPTTTTEAPTTLPTPCTIGCGIEGSCDGQGVDCVCRNNYTGVLCGIPPNIDVCSGDGACFVNNCTTSSCVVGEGGGKVCHSVPRDCDDGNPCTINTCDDSSGCQTTTKFCDDGIQCTDDSCDAGTGLCVHIQPNCSYLDSECYTSYCSNVENVTQRCQKQQVVCENPTNCSISECREGDGCVSDEYACSATYYGIVAGIAGGIVAGIVIIVVFFVLVGAATAGGGYAISQHYNTESENNVHVSPLYKPSTRMGAGL